MRQRILLTVAMLIAFCGFAKAADKEAYAVYNNGTLTFYYDANRSTRTGEKYDLNNSFEKPGWCTDHKTDITTAVFDTSFKDARPTVTYYWFGEQTSLTSISGMENLNTEEVEEMTEMFRQCSALTSLDLSNFDTSKVWIMRNMFFACTALKTIYVGDGWTTNSVVMSSNSYKMFWNCKALVGGAGTTYDDSYVDKEYARIDGGTVQPGYFTEKYNEYDLKIAGTTVTTTNKSDVLGNGVFEFIPSSNTLKVKGDYTNTNDSYLIDSSIDGLTIDVTKDSELVGKERYTPIVLRKSATIKGNGKLTLECPTTGDGIELYSYSASLTIENMSIEIKAWFNGIGGQGTDSWCKEKLIIKSSDINILTNHPVQSNHYGAIGDFGGGVELQGCKVTSPDDAYIGDYGVYSSDGNLAKNVTITAGNFITTGLGEASPINDNGEMINDKAREGWFTIDGRKLNGKPLKKGIYIHNGKAVVN